MPGCRAVICEVLYLENMPGCRAVICEVLYLENGYLYQ